MVEKWINDKWNTKQNFQKPRLVIRSFHLAGLSWRIEMDFVRWSNIGQIDQRRWPCSILFWSWWVYWFWKERWKRSPKSNAKSVHGRRKCESGCLYWENLVCWRCRPLWQCHSTRLAEPDGFRFSTAWRHQNPLRQRTYKAKFLILPKGRTLKPTH